MEDLRGHLVLLCRSPVSMSMASQVSQYALTAFGIADDDLRRLFLDL